MGEAYTATLVSVLIYRYLLFSYAPCTRFCRLLHEKDYPPEVICDNLIYNRVVR